MCADQHALQADRYLRPAGTEGASEADLARLVTRDAMIGAGHADGQAGAFMRKPD